jgi:hypothetical protein
MGKSAPNPPAAPSPSATASAQSSSNAATAAAQAALNNVSQYTPEGSSVFNQTGSYTDANGDTVPTYSQTVSLQPNEQAALTNEQQLAQTLSGYGTNIAANNAGAIETPLNFSDLPSAPTSLGPAVNPMNYQGEANQAAEAAYAQGEGLIQPQQQYAQQQLASSLQNAGIPITSAAAQEQQNLLATQQMGQNNNLAESAIGLGQGEQQALENEALNAGTANAGLQNQAIQTGLQEQTLAQDQPINELSALLQGGGAIQNPSVMSPAQTGVSPTDVTGAQALSTNAQEQNYNAQVAAANAGNSALAGLGAAGITGTAMVIF